MKIIKPALLIIFGFMIFGILLIIAMSLISFPRVPISMFLWEFAILFSLILVSFLISKYLKI